MPKMLPGHHHLALMIPTIAKNINRIPFSRTRVQKGYLLACHQIGSRSGSEASCCCCCLSCCCGRSCMFPVCLSRREELTLSVHLIVQVSVSLCVFVFVFVLKMPPKMYFVSELIFLAICWFQCANTFQPVSSVFIRKFFHNIQYSVTPV